MDLYIYILYNKNIYLFIALKDISYGNLRRKILTLMRIRTQVSSFARWHWALGTMLGLQLSFYRPICYNNRAHCPLVKCLGAESALVAGAHSYFVESSFKCE